MPEKWNDASEKKLLLEVIAASNPSIPTAVWARIATAMGETYTMEACRQKYQGIKRNLKPSDSTPTSTPTRNNKSTTTAAKSRKRKAAKDADDHSDDDEPSTLFAPHATSPSPKKKKMKKEPSDANGAEVFKAEHAGAEGGVDLERDELYGNDDDAV